MLGLLLLALVLWFALGLDRSRRCRLHDLRSGVAGHHRHRAGPHHRRVRRDAPAFPGLRARTSRHVRVAMMQ